MYCVIQEIPIKKPDKGGYYKELVVEWMSITINGEDAGRYCYNCVGKFERPVKKAYKISIHQSYRENGMVKKKQYSICTVRYYDLAENMFSLYDWGGSRIEAVADALGCDEESLYDLIEAKLEPLQKAIKAEWSQTEEYKTHQKHKQILALHQKKKKEFSERYHVSDQEYDKCYDVFGELRNPEYLEKIKREYKQRQEYEEKSRSYQEKFYSNYANFNCNTASKPDEEKKRAYKEIFRAAAKALHPDANPNKDTSAAMQVLNELKSQWGI